AGPSLEEIFNLPQYGADGMEKKKLSPMARYLERLEGKANGETNASNKARDPNRYRMSDQDSSKEEGGVLARSKDPKKDEESVDRVQRLFGARTDDNSMGNSERRGTVGDIFGLGDSSKAASDWTKGQ